MVTTWKDMVNYRQRHDKVVERVSKKLKGKIFKTAPFDIITKNGNFIEIKISNAKYPSFKISEEELKFAESLTKKYAVWFYYHDDLMIMNGSKILELAKKRSFEKQFGHKKLMQKTIQLSKKRLSSISIIKI